MSDPKKLRILKLLTEMLEEITPESGVHDFDLTGKVFRGRLIYGANDPDTLISIVENPRPGAGVYADDTQSRIETWELLLQGWAKDDPRNPSDLLYIMMSAVERKLNEVVLREPRTGQAAYPDHFMFGGECTEFRFGPGTVRPPAEVGAKCFFYMPLRISLAGRPGE